MLRELSLSEMEMVSGGQTRVTYEDGTHGHTSTSGTDMYGNTRQDNYGINGHQSHGGHSDSSSSAATPAETPTADSEACASARERLNDATDGVNYIAMRPSGDNLNEQMMDASAFLGALAAQRIAQNRVNNHCN